MEKALLSLPDHADKDVAHVRRGFWIQPTNTPIEVFFNKTGFVNTASGLSAGIWRNAAGPLGLSHRIILTFSTEVEHDREPPAAADDARVYQLLYVGGSVWRCAEKMVAVFLQTHPVPEPVPWTGPTCRDAKFLVIWLHPTRKPRFLWLRTDYRIEFCKKLSKRGRAHGCFRTSPHNDAALPSDIDKLELSFNFEAANWKLVKHVLKRVEGLSNVFLAHGKGYRGNFEVYDSTRTSTDANTLAVLLQLPN